MFQKLGALAYFLATLHNRTARDSKVDFNKDCEYFDHILEHLCAAGRLGEDEAREFRELREGWREKSLCGKTGSLVHSDVTPANILFGDGPGSSLSTWNG